ncbi:hypothetical protein [Cystobacter fuscus]|uniref:hypothetical protein n=1 Tax=Cystobacter fuscus TaxID=43 RepID=UPI002B3256D4|nr:hypothetical protein F0U63_43645 [Cystobacter fuscus]
MRRNALTVLVPIQLERFRSLEKVLEKIGHDIQHNPHLSFDELKATHFLRWVIIPGPMLAFEANFDSTVEDFLRSFVRLAGSTLREHIYCHCAPPLRAEDTDEALMGYLLDHALTEPLFFQGYPGMSVESIDNDARVREHIQSYLDEARGKYQPGEEHQLHADIGRYLEARASAQALTLDPERPSWKKRLLHTGAVRVGLGVLALPVALPTGLALLGLRLVEAAANRLRGARGAAAHPTYRLKGRERRGRLLEREDFQTQNQLTHLVDLKPGLSRLLLVKLALWVWGYWARYSFAEGHLGGIEGIHFARWILVRNEEPLGAGRAKHRLLFFSNYDGSWEDYLGTFVDRASIGLTTIWCNTEGFPSMRLRVWPPRLELGADREEEFKEWVRQHQVYTQVWFTRHPDLSVSNIYNNRNIRAKAKARLSAEQVKEWLRWLS